MSRADLHEKEFSRKTLPQGRGCSRSSASPLPARPWPARPRLPRSTRSQAPGRATRTRSTRSSRSPRTTSPTCAPDASSSARARQPASSPLPPKSWTWTSPRCGISPSTPAGRRRRRTPATPAAARRSRPAARSCAWRRHRPSRRCSHWRPRTSASRSQASRVSKGVVTGGGKSVTYGQLIGGKLFNVIYTGHDARRRARPRPSRSAQLHARSGSPGRSGSTSPRSSSARRPMPRTSGCRACCTAASCGRAARAPTATARTRCRCRSTPRRSTTSRT